MKMNILSLALMSAALALGASPASAVTIDFESLLHVDSSLVDHGTSYSEDGFTLSQPGGQPFFGLNTFGTLASAFSGSTALLSNTDNGVTELTLTGGGVIAQTFALDGIAFGAETFPFPPALDGTTSAR